MDQIAGASLILIAVLVYAYYTMWVMILVRFVSIRPLMVALCGRGSCGARILFAEILRLRDPLCAAGYRGGSHRKLCRPRHAQVQQEKEGIRPRSVKNRPITGVFTERGNSPLEFHIFNCMCIGDEYNRLCVAFRSHGQFSQNCVERPVKQLSWPSCRIESCCNEQRGCRGE